jgi:hypothetical protein
MKIDKLYFELNQIIYFMNTLEILKKSTNTDTLIDSKKIIFLFESTIDEIIGRSEKLQKKLDKNLSYQEHKILVILNALNNNWVTKYPHRFKYTYNYELKKPEKFCKYPTIYILKLTNFLLFFHKKLMIMTSLDGMYLNENNSLEDLLKIYEEEIEYKRSEYEDYPEILKEQKNECIKTLNKLNSEEKQNEKNKYISDYKYPIKTKHSIVTVRNKKK